LDAVARTQTASAAPVAGANGPEDDTPTWYEIDWDQAEEDVRRLRQRIFAASQAGDLKRVRNLQKLMLRSRANAQLSVRRVTEVNAGRKTPGIDDKVVLTAPGKAELAHWVQRRSKLWTARPVKRVLIPKAGSRSKTRALGIPVIYDRCLQAQAAAALEPEWEARFEPKSYGFRPGRGCQDAIAAIFWTVAGRRSKRRWALDADLKAAFDHVDHDHILEQLGTFPARGAVTRWLKAGVVDKDGFAPTEEGVPQGGVISPLIFNIALHGMEEAAGAAYRWNPYRESEESVPGTPVVVRYADDLVALCEHREQAEQVKTRLTPWLATRGLAFNEDKTRVVHLEEGFDFLGFNVRRYRNGKLLIKPSTGAVKRIRKRLSDEMRALRGANASAVIRTLNPIVRGWSAYYRGVVSTATFQSLDHHLWRLTYKWALYRHNRRSKRRIISRYYGQFHPSRKDRWVFGDRESGAYLTQFGWTKIVRHDMVKGRASPDDPTLTEYWAQRRRRNRDAPPIGHTRLLLLRKQHGRCPICGSLLLHADHQPRSPEEWERWAAATRKAITVNAIALTEGSMSDRKEQRLVHENCRRRSTRQTQHSTSARP
jgi:RNA-directed DNA polymerase